MQNHHLFVFLRTMKPEKQYKKHKSSKGERLHWSPLKKGAAMPVTEEMLHSRRISEKEIDARHRSLNGHLSLLVP